MKLLLKSNVESALYFICHSRTIVRNIMDSHLHTRQRYRKYMQYPIQSKRTAIVRALILGTLLCLVPSSYSYAEPRPTRSSRHDIQVDQRNRRYLLQVPRSYQDGTAVPLVFIFTDGNQWARDTPMLSRFNALSAEHGFIAVYPESLDERWDDGVRIERQKKQSDDVAFIARLAAVLSSTYSIHDQKLYAIGYSNGGTMVLRLACELPGLFAGIAIVGASFPKDLVRRCEAPEAVSVLMMNGTQDGSVPWITTDPRILRPESRLLIPVDDTIKFWARRAACGENPNRTRVTNLEVKNVPFIDRYEFQSCRSGYEIVLYALNNSGHAWPVPNLSRFSEILVEKLARTQMNSDDAAQVIWEFLAKQRRQVQPTARTK